MKSVHTFNEIAKLYNQFLSAFKIESRMYDFAFYTIAKMNYPAASGRSINSKITEIGNVGKPLGIAPGDGLNTILST